MADEQAQFRDLLSVEFEKRKARNPSYSLRGFARDLEVQPSTLSEILSNKRKVTRQMALRFLDRLPQESVDVTELMNAFDRRQVPRANYTKLDLMKFSTIARWYYFAIVNLCQIPDFKGDESVIAHRLGLDKTLVIEAVSELAELGLIEKNETGWQATSQNLAVGEDVLSDAIQQSHKEHLELAAASIMKHPLDRRDFSLINITTDAAELKLAAKKIKNFLRSLCAELEKSERKNTIFRVGLQMFPLTVTSGEDH